MTRQKERFTKTQRVLAEMIGKEVGQLVAEPEVELAFTDLGTGVVCVEFSVSTLHFLDAMLVFDGQFQKRLESFHAYAQTTNWFETCNRFAERWEGRRSSGYVEHWNNYGDTFLSHHFEAWVLKEGMLRAPVAIVMIHQYGDTRVNYSYPRCFRYCEEEMGIWESSHSIMCSRDSGHAWSWDGMRWAWIGYLREEEETAERQLRQRALDRLEYSQDPADMMKPGKLYVRDGVGHCPICGAELKGWMR